MKGFDLPVMDGTRKSFYGKAKVIEHDNGDICLISYSTLVARIHNGNFEKLWDGYSATSKDVDYQDANGALYDTVEKRWRA